MWQCVEHTNKKWMCVFACTCGRERQRERERERVCEREQECVCKRERKRVYVELTNNIYMCVRMSMCGGQRERESVCVCVCERERERERERKRVCVESSRTVYAYILACSDATPNISSHITHFQRSRKHNTNQNNPRTSGRPPPDKHFNKVTP